VAAVEYPVSQSKTDETSSLIPEEVTYSGAG